MLMLNFDVYILVTKQDDNREITKVQDDGAVQKVAYSRFDIAQIEHTEPGDRTVDILASVLSFEAHNTFENCFICHL